MQNYKVWLRARDPKTLEVVASVRVYNHEDRLAAEKVLETAQTRLQLLVLQLLHVHPGAIVSTETELPERTFMGQPSPRQDGMPKAMAAQYGVPMLWSHDPEKAMAEMQQVAKDALRFRKLHSHLCGYIENGGGDALRIAQDDATRDWSLSVGTRSYYATSFEAVVDKAQEMEGDKS